jgi:hypothetical protein
VLAKAFKKLFPAKCPLGRSAPNAAKLRWHEQAG